MKNYPPELIKSLVKKKGGSLAKLAKRAGFHPTEVQVVKGAFKHI